MDTKPKTLLLIFNPKAGRSKPRGPLFDALALLSEGGYLVRIHRTTAAGDAAETAAREGGQYDLVVASGGDGTLNEVISGLSRLEHPPLLGYLPQGSTNDFAASLRLPANPEQGAAAILQGRVQVLDIGQWNQRYFVYVASFGAFTKTSYSAPQAAKNALGHFAYILEGMKDLNSLRPYRRPSAGSAGRPAQLRGPLSPGGAGGGPMPAVRGPGRRTAAGGRGVLSRRTDGAG